MPLGCYFTARGRRFEADSFLSTTTLKPDAVFHRGDPLTPLDGRVQETGFSVTVCYHALFGDLGRQIPRAHRFLRENQRELSSLARSHRVTDLRLTFPLPCPGDRMGYEYFPAELLALAATFRISIGLSFYPGPPQAAAKERGSRTLRSTGWRPRHAAREFGSHGGAAIGELFVSHRYEHRAATCLADTRQVQGPGR